MKNAKKKPPKTLEIRRKVVIYEGHHVAEIYRDRDEMEGGVVARVRVVDQWPIDRLRVRGVISREQWEAGDRFRAVFGRALLDATARSSLERVDGARAEISDHAAAARIQINRLMALLGKIGGSATWHIVGMGEPVKAWCWRWGASGLSIRESEARGVLRAALDVLAKHWGLGNDTGRKAN